MKIAFVEHFLSLPEREAFLRLQKAFENIGHELIFLNASGFDTQNNAYADDLGVDLCIYTDFATKSIRKLPNCPCLFFKWCPSGYLHHWYYKSFFYRILNSDFILTNCQTNDTKNIIHMCGDDKIYNYEDLPVYASVPKSACIPVKKKNVYKLFYVGLGNDNRYNLLFNQLDLNNLIEFYGPKDYLSKYNNYKGSIPFDGFSIMKNISEAGICLAFISKEHMRTGHITNRIWEGLAAGAVCIVNESEYLREAFGDSLYYVNLEENENIIFNQIYSIIDEINKNPEIAYNKAVKAQNIFKEKFSAEIYAQNIVEAYNRFMQSLSCEGKDKRIDIIAYVNTVDDLMNIVNNIKRQIYINKFIHFIINPKIDINYDFFGNLQYSIYRFNAKDRGESLKQILKNIKGEYFAFVDGKTTWQFKFLYKMQRYVERRKLDFAYSGTYYENVNKDGKINHYDYLLTESMKNEELFSPLNPNFSEVDYFNLEENFAIGSILFDSKTLSDVDETKLSIFKDSPHIYFAVKSLLKNIKSGAFARMYLAGYRKNMEDDKRQAQLSEEYFKLTNRPGAATYNSVLMAFIDDLCLTDNLFTDHKIPVLNENSSYIITKYKKISKTKFYKKIYFMEKLKYTMYKCLHFHKLNDSYVRNKLKNFEDNLAEISNILTNNQ